MNRKIKWPFVKRQKYEISLKEAERLVQEMTATMDKFMYFAEKGQEAARLSLSGYVMVDKKFLPKNKCCPLFMGHGKQFAADNLGVFSKKWKREYDHEMRQKLSKLNSDWIK